MSYKLDDGVEESFDFSIGGYVYVMRYPNTEEIAGITKVSQDASVKEIEDQLKWIYPLVTSPDGAPTIKEALYKSNIKVLRNFVEMVKKEFGAE